MIEFFIAVRADRDAMGPPRCSTQYPTLLDRMMLARDVARFIGSFHGLVTKDRVVRPIVSVASAVLDGATLMHGLVGHSDGAPGVSDLHVNRTAGGRFTVGKFISRTVGRALGEVIRIGQGAVIRLRPGNTEPEASVIPGPQIANDVPDDELPNFVERILRVQHSVPDDPLAIQNSRFLDVVGQDQFVVLLIHPIENRRRQEDFVIHIQPAVLPQHHRPPQIRTKS